MALLQRRATKIVVVHNTNVELSEDIRRQFDDGISVQGDALFSLPQEIDFCGSLFDITQLALHGKVCQPCLTEHFTDDAVGSARSRRYRMTCSTSSGTLLSRAWGTDRQQLRAVLILQTCKEQIRIDATHSGQAFAILAKESAAHISEISHAPATATDSQLGDTQGLLFMPGETPKNSNAENPKHVQNFPKNPQGPGPTQRNTSEHWDSGLQGKYCCNSECDCRDHCCCCCCCHRRRRRGCGCGCGRKPCAIRIMSTVA